MIHRKVKTLNELKVKIMKELQVNPALHNIHIAFRSSYEVLNQCINYRYMEITEDKHVKFMFSKMQKWEQAADFELYVTLEPRAEVGVEEEIVQTTTSLQFAVLNDRCTTLGVPVVEDKDEDCFGEDPNDRDEYEERIDNGDFDRGVDDHEISPIPDVDDMAECDEDDMDANHAIGFSWNADMNFAKWLIFASKEAVKHALTIYAAKPNRNSITSRSTKSRLSVKCVDESCIWYVGAVQKPEHDLWMVTSYRGPHSCIPLATALDGRMMNYNFLAAEFVPLLEEKHTATIYHLRDFTKGKYYGHKLSYYKIWDAKQ
ncbi:uncharacterized protein LOC136063051 [Quercus suber]|uniref:uncharacterized protein LOC136063051 n=1 Tax=Quercus suber TaxID=58331 RepID=UPI0032DFFDD2